MIEVDFKKKVKTYNGFDQLRIQTTFPAKAVTQIVGPSGAGKTTLLKIIAGLIKPEEGYVSAFGEVWLDTKKGIDLRPQDRKVGFVFQDYALFPNMTVENHLLFGTNDREFIKRLVQFGQLKTFLNHKPKYLSGGQQQRLAILRALSTKPKLLLMDEPFSALDSSLKNEMINGLKELLSEIGTTCLVVTHQLIHHDLFMQNIFELK